MRGGWPWKSRFVPSVEACSRWVPRPVRSTGRFWWKYVASTRCWASGLLTGFLLMGLLGQGGMGDVFLAWQASMHRRVAIKVVSQEVMVRQGVLERFRREAHLTASLRSPHTVATFDYGSLPNGMQYFAMEYIPGRTLADVLATEGPIPVWQAVELLQQVCLSLEEAHDTGIVHRDLKPGNVMVTAVGKGQQTAKVLDFGIAKVVGPEAQTLTETGCCRGYARVHESRTGSWAGGKPGDRRVCHGLAGL